MQLPSADDRLRRQKVSVVIEIGFVQVRATAAPKSGRAAGTSCLVRTHAKIVNGEGSEVRCAKSWLAWCFGIGGDRRSAFEQIKKGKRTYLIYSVGRLGLGVLALYQLIVNLT